MARPSRGERESIALRRKNEALDRPMRLNRSFTDISEHSNRPQVFTGKGFLPGLGEISRTEQYIQTAGKNKQPLTPQPRFNHPIIHARIRTTSTPPSSR